MTSPLVEACADAARDVIRRCASPHGWLAAVSGFAHYESVWTRDAGFTGLALMHEPEEHHLDVTRATLEGLVQRQAPLGQMPVAYFPRDGVWDWGETGNTDGTALFVLLGSAYLQRRPDDSLRAALIAAMERAVTWLRHQDANNMLLIDSPQASDWMDSTLNRSGKVLYVNVLYAGALGALGRVHPEAKWANLAADVRDRINLLFWPEDAGAFHQLLRHVAYPDGRPRFSHAATLAAYGDAIDPGRAHYVAHVEYGRFVNACDVLANVLAVLLGVADALRARRILEFLTQSDAVQPYPARSWLVPFTTESDAHGVHKRDAERFQDPRWHNPPHAYHNAAVWPFIGGHLVAACAAAGMRDISAELLERLAEANQRSGDAATAWGFHEWIASDTGAPGGAALQAWSAAGFLLAVSSVRRGLGGWPS